ncbi:MAG TPA: SPOR domain-containing protein [Steroidobacteraceae bacterium]|nr:SPOR domain-containing protein [Steroidobacteraceae bacterium]
MPRLTTRDYKRTSRGSGAAKLKEFGLGVVVGAVLASAAFLIAGAHARHAAAAHSGARAGADSQGAAPHAPAPDDTSSDDPDSTAPSNSPPAAAQAQQYDFYRMLPRIKVPVSHDDEQPAHAVPPPAAADPPQRTADSGRSYVLQIGSYRSTAEADQVRGRLARDGISAQVQRIVQGSSTWNRVRIGPLSDAELTRVREQLRTANIHALVIRADR